MATFTKQQAQQMFQQAEAQGISKQDFFKSAIQQGYSFEGLDSQQVLNQLNGVQQTQPQQDGFLKSAAKDVVETLAVKPVARATEAVTRLVAPQSMAAKGFEQGQTQSFNVPGLGNVDVEAQKAFGEGGGRQIAGEALQIGSFLFPYGKAAGAVTKATGSKVAGNIASGATGGYMADVGFNLEDEDKTLGESFAPGLGTILGGVLPAIGPTARAIKGATKSTKTTGDVAKRVIQGKTKDIPLAERAFQNIDITGVKTRQELSDRLSQAMESQMNKVDEVLSQDPQKYGLDNFAIKQVNDAGQEVTTDVVSNALNHLEEVFTQAGDNLSKSNIQLLKQRAVQEGLTRKEVNDIARMYSQEFGSKAFRKTGEPLTSVSAQMFENTRKGLKQASRAGFDLGEEAMQADRLYSAMSNTKRLIDRGVEGVNALQARLKDQNVFQKLTRNAVKMLNTLSGGTLKTAFETLGVSNVGNKIDNWIDLEKSLAKDLEFITKANQTQEPGKLIKAINDYAKKFQFPGDKLADDVGDMVSSAKENLNNPRNAKGGFIKIGNENIPDDLVQEARKYKSAEEFVDNFTFGGEGSPLMHGTNAKLIGNKLKVGSGDIKRGGQSGGLFLTDNPDIAQVFGKDIYYADKMLKNQVFDLTNFYDRRLLNSYVGKTYKTYDGDIVKFTRQDLDNMLPNGKADFASISQYPELIEKIVKENGLKGVAFREYAGGKWGKTFQFFEDEIPVYSKSQLEEIWKKANSK